MFKKPNLVLVFVRFTLLALTSCNGHDKPSPPPPTSASPETAPPTERLVGPLSPADAQALSTMNDRLREYIDLHTKLERSLPKLFPPPVRGFWPYPSSTRKGRGCYLSDGAVKLVTPQPFRRNPSA